jgi:hypothetical protein
MIEKRVSHTLNTVGDAIVAVGGRCPSPDGPDLFLSSVEMYREKQKGWQLGTWELTSGRFAFCAATLTDSELILAGGYRGYEDGDQLSLVEIYNIVTGSVATLPPLREARSYAACTVQGNGFILSGGQIDWTLDTTQVERLDLTSQTWSYLPSLNIARKFHSMGMFNGAPVVFGGRVFESWDTMEILTDVGWLLGSDLYYTWMRQAMVQLTCPAV